jgi:hypothetical protein
MKKQMSLPLESEGRDQRHRLWGQIPERDRTEWIAQCAALIARAARTSSNAPFAGSEIAAPQQQEESREANDR